MSKRGVFTAAHTCTGHICECPPPRAKADRNNVCYDPVDDNRYLR